MNIRKWMITAAALSAATVLSGGALAQDWSGFYAGVHGALGKANVDGAYSGTGDFLIDNDGSFDLDPGGLAGGVQAGFNWQNGYFVYGIEGDITAVDWDETLINGSGELVQAETGILATLRGRAGYAMDGTMIYGTAGVAWTDTEYYVNDHTNSTSSNEMGTLDLDGIGFVAGAGVEAKVNQMWSIKGEALYFFFNDDQDGSDLTHDSDPTDFAELKDAWTVRIGVNRYFTSDRRLKRDITHVATLETGIELYRFKYLWDDQVHVGVMAQDLLADDAFRDAVVMTQNGYYAVNYEMLGLKMATLDAWREYGLAAVSLQPSGSQVSSLMENVLR